MIPFVLRRGVRIRHASRSALALVLSSTIMAPWLPGQNSATDKIYKQLAAIPIHSKIEVRLTTGTRIRGELLSFDRAEVQMSGQAAPIALSDIRSVKRLDQSSGRKWNPIWGISGSWKTAAIAGGMLLLLGIVAAKNTR